MIGKSKLKKNASYIFFSVSFDLLFTKMGSMPKVVALAEIWLANRTIDLVKVGMGSVNTSQIVTYLFWMFAMMSTMMATVTLVNDDVDKMLNLMLDAMRQPMLLLNVVKLNQIQCYRFDKCLV